MWRKGAAAGLVIAAVWTHAGSAASVCDGRQDATAALNAMLARGGEVRLPAGVCLVSNSLLVRSGTVVSGAGIGRTVIKASPTPEYPVISIGSARGGASNVDLSGLTVDGSGTRIMERPNDGILSYFGSTEVRIHNLEVRGAGGNGIKVVGSNIDVSDNSVHDNFANGIYAVGRQKVGAVVPTTNVRVLRNRVSHNSLGGMPPAKAWDGIDIDPATANCLIEGNTVIGNDIILFETGRYAANSSGHRVTRNTIIDSVANGIDVAGAITDFQLIGNRIERTRGFGIVINGPVAHGVVRGNVILGTTKAGILIDNYIHLPGVPRDLDVSGNTVDPGPSAGRSPSVMVRGRATNVRVVGNRVSITGINAAGAGAGILVQANH